jgi:hypothetical protein
MTIAGWLAWLRSSVRSYGIALKGSSRFGRSIKLRRAGRLREALEVSREGLALLSNPVVCRLRGPEGSALVCLTLQVEGLAHELGEQGAAERDIADSLSCLKTMSPDARREAADIKCDWLPYLEARLEQLRSRGTASER